MSNTETPSGAPTAAETDDDTMDVEPTLPPIVDIRTATAVDQDEGPTLIPPTATAAQADEDEAITAAVWHNNKKVTRQFHAGSNNSWIALEGVGWRRLNGANPAACTAMSMIAAHAVDNGSTVNAYQAHDNTIHTLNAW